MSEQNDLFQVRLEKLDYISSITNPYPERFVSTHAIKEVKFLEDDTLNVCVAGRILFLRKMGKMSFMQIGDLEGRIQICLKKDILNDDYDFFKKGFDIGDFIGISGDVFTTQTGEKTIMAKEITFLGKSLRTLPEKFHGITDIEACYRQRYLDLIMNDETKNRFINRIKFIREIRRYLDDNDYMEIETPILTDHASGASAKPFISHHNAFDMDVYLRIAPETYLKRAIVGGFTKVYEVARCFRNEGVDSSHLQDFTMIEGYCAYYNYKDNMKFLRNMLLSVIQKVWGTTIFKINGNEIDLNDEWQVVTFRDLILNDCGIDIDLYKDAKTLLNEIKFKKINLNAEVENLGRGNLIDLLYKRVSRPNIIKPTFLIEHPTDLSPLARSNDFNKEIVDRFQLIINGTEVINAYSELVDPIEQRRRLVEQARLKSNGDEEAMMMDEDYIKAMEYGMPPISGWGMGIDRIYQILTDTDNIRDSVMFPLMK